MRGNNMKDNKTISLAYTDSQLADIVAFYKSGITDFGDIADKINKKYKLSKSGESIRHAYRRYGHLFDMTDAEIQIRHLKDVARVKRSNSKTAKENRIILDNMNELEDAAEIFNRMLRNVKFKMHPPLPLPKKALSKSKRAIIAHISDTHFGTNISEGEMAGLNAFNGKIAARRLAYFMKQVCEYKLQYRNETELVILFNGDIQGGIIHNQEHVVDRMTTQFAMTVSLFGQAISYAARNFKKVTVYCNGGNHERFQHKADKGRATTDKWDSFATMSYVALREKFSEYENVDFHIPEAPFCMFQVLGHRMFSTHGDTVFNVGNVGKKIDMGSILNQTDKINNSELADEGNFEAFFVGHVHTPTVQLLENGAYAVINGTLSGLDGFANSIGIFGNAPTQQLIEVTTDHPIGDMRFIQLKKADKDKSLDKIIEPLKAKF